MNIVQFNKELKKKMVDVKIQEKMNPKIAKKMWIDIVKFLIIFGKSNDCPSSLKRTIGLQAEKILNKVKKYESGQLKSVFDRVPQSSSKTMNEELSEEEMLAKLEQLPQVPNQLESDTTDHLDQIDDRDDIEPSVEMIKDLNKGEERKSKEETRSLFEILETIDSIGLPEGITEIKPGPFNNNTIIPQKNNEDLNLEQYKKETTLLDITKEQINSEREPPQHASIVNKADRVVQSIKDKREIQNIKICKSCGAELDPEEKICSVCGMEIEK